MNQRFAKCLITCIGDIVLTRPYRGVLRKEDVRSFDKDRVEMYKCYRPGDIILARVVSFVLIPTGFGHKSCPLSNDRPDADVQGFITNFSIR